MTTKTRQARPEVSATIEKIVAACIRHGGFAHGHWVGFCPAHSAEIAALSSAPPDYQRADRFDMPDGQHCGSCGATQCVIVSVQDGLLAERCIGCGEQELLAQERPSSAPPDLVQLARHSTPPPARLWRPIRGHRAPLQRRLAWDRLRDEFYPVAPAPVVETPLAQLRAIADVDARNCVIAARAPRESGEGKHAPDCELDAAIRESEKGERPEIRVGDVVISDNYDNAWRVDDQEDVEWARTHPDQILALYRDPLWRQEPPTHD